MKRLLGSAAIAAVLGVGALALSAGSASAYIVCNDDGDCWHVDHRYHDDDVHVRFRYHPDDWYFHRDWDHDHDHRWRAWRDGHGYWRNGVWITF